MGHSPRNLPGAHERGVVMLVVLILLLLVTIVGFSVMEISSSQVKMAVNREGREVSFQGAESAIETVADDEQQLVDAFVAGLGKLTSDDPDSITWPTVEVSYDADSDLSLSVETRYTGDIPALGNDLVIGSPGLRSLHFELRASAARDAEKFDSIHVQGISRFAPRLD
ncbi:MAG: PilX N-terminal domain-containing pilus assembly protein [Haliea sp.]|jgi:hypothetical protein|nr:PilX N-terminal domain-containing pilus assembly protein [Haliea sp.]